MALNPEDACGGFHHAKVVAFINEKMTGHVKGPEFYLENMSLSWEEVEDKLRAILEDNDVPSEAKEACAWGGLALGVRFARRQSQLQGRRVQRLHDFAKLHRSAAQALAADLKELTAQQELERKEAAFQLQLLQASLAEVQKERDRLRWKLLQAELQQPLEQATGWPRLATAGGAGTEGEGEEAQEEVATWWPSLATADWTGAEGEGKEEEEGVAAAADATEGEEERDAAAAATAPATEAAQELGGSFLQLLGAVEQKNFTSGGQREGELRSVETAMFDFSGAEKPEPTVSPATLPVQLPASFTYSYSCPLSPFPDPPTPIPSPPAATFTAAAPPQTAAHCGASDVNVWPDVGTQGIDPQEPQRSRRDPESHQQRRAPIVRRLGDWDCPWCKAVNFSRRKICFRCGRGIWLQNS
ncbi:testis-expressed protein 13B [Dugong dugon]